MKKILIGLLVVGLGWLGWNFVNSEGEVPYWENIKDTVQDDGKNETKDEDKNNDTEETMDGTVWLGKLEKSSDTKRGSLMLIMQDSDRTVFINTSRDYSALIGKDVKVTIDGDFSGFTLLNIESQ